MGLLDDNQSLRFGTYLHINKYDFGEKVANTLY